MTIIIYISPQQQKALKLDVVRCIANLGKSFNSKYTQLSKS